jgi:hypothetical protein
MLGKKITVQATFDLGALNPEGKPIKAKPLEVQL